MCWEAEDYLNYVQKTSKNCASWELLMAVIYRWAPEVLHDMLKLAKHVWHFFFSQEETKSLSVVYESEPYYIYWSSCTHPIWSHPWGIRPLPHPGRALVPLTPWTLWCVARSCHSFRYGLTDWCCLVKMKVAGKDSFIVWNVTLTSQNY